MQETQHGAGSHYRQPTNSYLMPLAIVVAGALVAGSVYFTRSESGPAVQGAAREQIAIDSIGEADHILGTADAPAILVEYSDTDCPFCQRFHLTMKQLMDEYGKEGKLAWVYRHFPIPQLHPDAAREAEALECAASLGGNAKFWEYADILYSRQRTQTDPGHPALETVAENLGMDAAAFKACLDEGRFKAEVEKDTVNAQESGGNGTPHNVLVLKEKLSKDDRNAVTELMIKGRIPPEALAISEDGQRIRIGGAFPIEFMRQILDVALK